MDTSAGYQRVSPFREKVGGRYCTSASDCVPYHEESGLVDFEEGEVCIDEISLRLVLLRREPENSQPEDRRKVAEASLEEVRLDRIPVQGAPMILCKEGVMEVHHLDRLETSVPNVRKL